MNSVRSNNLSLKYQRVTPSGCKDIGIRKFEFVVKTQIYWQGKKKDLHLKEIVNIRKLCCELYEWYIIL